MSSYYKAVFDLSRPIEVKIPEERDILAKMSASAVFTDPPVAYQEFTTALDEQDVALANAQQGGTMNTATMRAKEKVVDDMVRKYRTYVTLVADGDTEVILSSGFRHTKERENGKPMPVVEEVSGGSNGISGEAKLRWKPVTNSQYYEIQVRPTNDKEPTEKDDNTEKWVPYTSKGSSAVIAGLSSLTYYEVRVRAKGVAGYGPFSNVIVVLVT